MPAKLTLHHTTTATATRRRSPRCETLLNLPVPPLKQGTTAPPRQERPETRPTAGCRYVGLDVHAASIAIALAEPDGQVHAYGTIPNTPIAVRTLLKRFTRPGLPLAVCNEPGPMGYRLYRQLHAMHIHCDVIAPSLIPTAAGDRIKTDRRDALKLARWYRSDDLTPVWVPDAAHEALRDLVRAREDAMSDRTRTRHRLTIFCANACTGRPTWPPGRSPSLGPSLREWPHDPIGRTAAIRRTLLGCGGRAHYGTE